MYRYVYKSILTKHLNVSASKIGINENFIFQQDNDPKYNSQYLKDFLGKKHINVLDWPSQSLDLNSIEHLWDHLKAKVKVRESKGIKELEKIVIETWNNINPEHYNKLVKTMNDRITSVLKAKGGHIPY